MYRLAAECRSRRPASLLDGMEETNELAGRPYHDYLNFAQKVMLE